MPSISVSKKIFQSSVSFTLESVSTVDFSRDKRMLLLGNQFNFSNRTNCEVVLLRIYTESYILPVTHVNMESSSNRETLDW